MTKKIAYVHYPHFANDARLETVPFSLNPVVFLANMGWEVDLYLWEKPGANYHALLPETVKIKYFREPQLSLHSRLHLLRRLSFPVQFLWRKSYCGVFGYGQIGAYIANIIAKSNQCPFIYFNDEFPSGWGENPWTQLERQAVQNAAMVVVPDLHRFHPLCQELDVSTKPYAVLPNMPMIKPPFEEINWHEKLGIPKDYVPFLYAGTMVEWAQIPEILSSLPYWPEKAVLILHSRSRQSMEKYRKELSHLEVSGKVIWTHESMSDSQINSLVAYCAGNFALYRNTGPNFEYIGFSSGKLMRSLACGSPVIASRLLSLSFVEEFQLGFLVRHPAEIPDAIQGILDNRAAYAQRCLEFCRDHASFERAWSEFSPKLQKLIK
jgi:glycosyltransferase involved in cell wall biosynthesis